MRKFLVKLMDQFKIKNTIISFLDRFFPQKFYLNKSYSQSGEDMILYSFFDGKKNYKGYYIDVGAHHPFRFSNTAFFYRKGWCGINIEPTPTLIGRFKKFRRRDINLNIAVSNSNEPLIFHQFNEPALNSFDEKLSKERVCEKYQIIKTESIKPYRLEEILDTYLPKGQEIDFFSIDVEGFDLEVLKSNNWNKYSPNYILVEDFEDGVKTNDTIFSFLSKLNYEKVACSKLTTLYKRNNI